jgi:hypothetical protein
MTKAQVKAQFTRYGMRQFIHPLFDPATIKDDYSREVIIKARTYLLEGEKRLKKYLIPPKKGGTQ